MREVSGRPRTETFGEPDGLDRLLSDRARLLAAVAKIGSTLQAGADRSDNERRLVPESVDALKQNGLWRMRLCAELGGLELPIVTQIEVLAALATEDPASAWCTMVINNGLALIGATMPDAAIDRVFADGVPVCSVVAASGGKAKPVEGGFLISGSWRLASAIHHAEWIHASTFIDGDPSRLMPFVVRVQDVSILDTWNVIGLAATGSNDFALNDHFIPSEFAGREFEPFAQVRGRRRYDLVDVEQIDSYEHLAFAIGIARRALRELREILARRPFGRHVGDRELVQEQFGRSVIRLQAVEALTMSLYERIDAAALGQLQCWSGGERHLPRAGAAQATELALECVQLAFRRSGLAALHRPNVFEKLLRDMSVAANHAVVDDSTFDSLGQNLVESGLPLDSSRIAANV